MILPVACGWGALLALLLAVPVRAGGVGEPLRLANTPAAHQANVAGISLHTLQVVSRVATDRRADTTRRSVPADTTRQPALVPDTTTVLDEEDKPTRKTTLLVVLAIAVLTISTLLLYNVRSR